MTVKTSVLISFSYLCECFQKVSYQKESFTVGHRVWVFVPLAKQRIITGCVVQGSIYLMVKGRKQEHTERMRQLPNSGIHKLSPACLHIINIKLFLIRGPIADSHTVVIWLFWTFMTQTLILSTAILRCNLSVFLYLPNLSSSCSFLLILWPFLV